MTFEFAPDEIVAVEERAFESPFAKAFDLPLTRLHTARSGMLGEFLVCSGHPLSPSTMRQRSMELRASLQQFAGTASAHR